MGASCVSLERNGCKSQTQDEVKEVQSAAGLPGSAGVWFYGPVSARATEGLPDLCNKPVRRLGPEGSTHLPEARCIAAVLITRTILCRVYTIPVCPLEGQPHRQVRMGGELSLPESLSRSHALVLQIEYL